MCFCACRAFPSTCCAAWLQLFFPPHPSPVETLAHGTLLCQACTNVEDVKDHTMLDCLNEATLLENTRLRFSKVRCSPKPWHPFCPDVVQPHLGRRVELVGRSGRCWYCHGKWWHGRHLCVPIGDCRESRLQCGRTRSRRTSQRSLSSLTLSRRSRAFTTTTRRPHTRHATPAPTLSKPILGPPLALQVLPSVAFHRLRCM